MLATAYAAVWSTAHCTIPGFAVTPVIVVTDGTTVGFPASVSQVGIPYPDPPKPEDRTRSLGSANFSCFQRLNNSLQNVKVSLVICGLAKFLSDLLTKRLNRCSIYTVGNILAYSTLQL